MAHDVQLFAGAAGVALEAWDRYDLALDMLAPGSPWTVSLWWSADDRSAWQLARQSVKLLDSMSWQIDGAEQVNGRIETIETHGSRAGAVMIVSGRDMTGPAMDWDADPTLKLKGKPLDEALSALLAPLGIPVRIGVGADAAREVQSGTRRGPRGTTTHRRRHAVDQAHPQPGERIWQLADAIVRRLGYMLWCAPDTAHGLAVVVDTPAFAQSAAYQFERRAVGDGTRWEGNILDGSEHLNGRDQPTTVQVYTHAPRGDAASARQSTTVLNPAIVERAINRGFLVDPLPVQPRHVRADRARTLSAAGQEGARIVGDATARFRSYTTTVRGHGQTTGARSRLYAINSMAHVRDDLCTDPDGAPLDEDMLLARVQFSGSRADGQTTRCTLIPKDSILLSPSAD